MAEHDTEKFGIMLLGEDEVETALKRLDKLTQDEARAIETQILKVVSGIDGKYM